MFLRTKLARSSSGCSDPGRWHYLNRYAQVSTPERRDSTDNLLAIAGGMAVQTETNRLRRGYQIPQLRGVRSSMTVDVISKAKE
jgi:hypothetical protein